MTADSMETFYCTVAEIDEENLKEESIPTTAVKKCSAVYNSNCGVMKTGASLQPCFLITRQDFVMQQLLLDLIVIVPLFFMVFAIVLVEFGDPQMRKSAQEYHERYGGRGFFQRRDRRDLFFP
jgi:hypothetical protein